MFRFSRPQVGEMLRVLGASLALAILLLAAWDQLQRRPMGLITLWAALVWLYLMWDLRPRRAQQALSASIASAEEASPLVPQEAAAVAGQLLPDAEAWRERRRQVNRPAEIDDRAEAALFHRLKSADLSEVRQALSQIKERGWWPYFAPQLIRYSLSGTRANSLLEFIAAGAVFPRFDESYDPALFRSIVLAWDAEAPDPEERANPFSLSYTYSGAGTLHVPLFEALLALGSGIEDRDIAEHTLLDRLLIEAKQRCDISSTFGAPTDAPHLVGDLRRIMDAGATVSPSALARMEALMPLLETLQSQALQSLITEITLEADTPPAPARPSGSSRL